MPRSMSMDVDTQPLPPAVSTDEDANVTHSGIPAPPSWEIDSDGISPLAVHQHREESIVCAYPPPDPFCSSNIPTQWGKSRSSGHKEDEMDDRRYSKKDESHSSTPKKGRSDILALQKMHAGVRTLKTSFFKARLKENLIWRDNCTQRKQKERPPVLEPLVKGPALRAIQNLHMLSLYSPQAPAGVGHSKESGYLQQVLKPGRHRLPKVPPHRDLEPTLTREKKDETVTLNDVTPASTALTERLSRKAKEAVLVEPAQRAATSKRRFEEFIEDGDSHVALPEADFPYTPTRMHPAKKLLSKIVGNALVDFVLFRMDGRRESSNKEPLIFHLHGTSTSSYSFHVKDFAYSLGDSARAFSDLQNLVVHS
ncbi:hypothetical protein BDZ91DRAFT_764692 [Kalaharituber pfeilii]|nr:hypothetical protein BDZ91DRAFT_764692 [Kalaharituber pfeilii]